MSPTPSTTTYRRVIAWLLLISFLLQPFNSIAATDPRFANYNSFISSDYMLSRLSMDPQRVQKRLGDGFYEQKLVLDQVAQLTGRRFLPGNTDGQQQFQALMESGVAAASVFDLTPGIALTDAQIANLTHDIVWMEEETVTLPDGSSTVVLAPRVYLTRLHVDDLTPSGAVIAANDIDVVTHDTLTNSGTIQSTGHTKLAANDINNIGGVIKSDADNLTAIANGNLTIDAAKNVDKTDFEFIRKRSRNIEHSVDETIVSAEIKAGGNVTLAAVAPTTGTPLVPSISIAAANISSDKGKLNLIADGNVDLTVTHENDSSYKEQYNKKKGFLSSKSRLNIDQSQSDTAVGNSLSADSINIQAGRDLTATGANVVATNDVSLSAARDVTITSAESTASTSHLNQQKKSGLSFSGNGISLGSSKLNSNTAQQTTTQTASTVGSLTGDVTITAGEKYTQTGSDLLTPQGSIDIAAKQVNISAAQETQSSQQSMSVKQSGISLSLSSPVINAVQTASQMTQAAKDTSDPRMKALAAATAALAAKNAADAIQAGNTPKLDENGLQVLDANGQNTAENPINQIGGLSLNLSFGSSKSSSQSSQNATTAKASTLTAGQDITITATGSLSPGERAEGEGNINVIGSQLKADRDLTLAADGKVNLLAAANTSNSQSSNKSSSASIGVSLNLSTLDPSLNIGMSKGKGNSNGADVTYSNTTVTAGNTAVIQSGTDTNLKGATVAGKQVIADVGTSGNGNLNIESLQDSSTYSEKQKNAGFSASVSLSGQVGGSINGGKSNINSTYQSVISQSGIKAGDGGFDVNVNGNTDLKGTVIASTDKAVKDNANRLTTETLTTSNLNNKAEYSASSSSLGVGYSTGGTGVSKDQTGNATTGGNATPGLSLPSLNGVSATPPVALSAGDSAQSTTKSGISAGSINITDNTKQQALTGNTATQTIAMLNRDVSTDRNTSNSLTPIFTEQTKQDIKAGFEIVGAFSGQVGTFLGNRAKESTDAQKAIDAELAKPEDQRDQAVLTQAAQTLHDNAMWQMGGSGRIALTAVTAAFSGNVTGSGAELVQSAAVHTIQALGAQEIKQIADQVGGEGSPAHTALHAILACAGAAASSGDCGTAALAASGGVVINTLLDQLEGKDADKLTAAEKEARANLITTLISGTTAALGGDAATAQTAARIETENNALTGKDLMSDALYAVFASRHPVAALKIGADQDPRKVKDPNITTIASTFQINILGSQDGPGGAYEGGPSNAFRHVIWQAMITNTFDEDTAIAAGLAHDPLFPPSLPNGNYASLNQADTACDLSNNDIGRKIASDNPGISNIQLAQKILDQQHQEGFYQAVQQSDGSYKAEKVKLDNATYATANGNLRPLDQTGAGLIIRAARSKLP